MTVGLQTAMKFGIIKELFQSGFIEIIMAAICFQRIYIYIYIYIHIYRVIHDLWTLLQEAIS